ncbi:hypothetical protein V9L13_09450 [Pseudomonas sp. RSB 5.4]|uniref:hypothetical protein n=1 Tax=unclassified Pseudomonas TaxID=196821 RepID=UPI0021C6DE49|nr:hypothetical protein [Pseudomonas sp. 13B_3.2_Bac1]MCU1772511.1 hypothetical protein [Pseudomonas sp. 13B_3.2_Bac1]
MAANALWLLLMSCVCDFLTPGLMRAVTIKNHGAMSFAHSLGAQHRGLRKKAKKKQKPAIRFLLFFAAGC